MPNLFILNTSLGYGVRGVYSSSGDLCFSSSANSDIDTDVETIFTLNIGSTDSTFDIQVKPWDMYSDVVADTSGYICEKEGITKNKNITYYIKFT